MTQPNIAEIARSLSKAQKGALDTLTRIPRRSRLSGAALMALSRKGLALNGWSSFNGNVWSITPLGLLVRQHLLTEGEGR